MKVLLWGYGSIAAQHAKRFHEKGIQVCVLSRTQQSQFPHFTQLIKALAEKPDVILICTPTAMHYANLIELENAGYSGQVIVEKPLFHSQIDCHFKSLKAPKVAYNLRFHPLVQKLRSEIQNEEILTLNLYVGQYLPSWRPSQDYRQSYSAKKDMGGGVLLDLSHELDLSVYLAGAMTEIKSCGGKLSDLEIDTEDAWSVIARQQKSKLTTIHMNYLDRNKKRWLSINTNGHTYFLDFVHGSLLKDDQSIMENVMMSQSYDQMVQNISTGSFEEIFCSFPEGQFLNQLIDQMKQGI